MAYADVNGQRLWFEDSGGDGTPVVFSHGFLMDHTMFDAEVDALTPDFRCIRWDERGFGRTEDDGKPFTYWDSATDVLGLMDHLGIDQAVLAGMSQGGFLSLRAALTSPHRVRALVLMDTGSDCDDAETLAAYQGMNDLWVSPDTSQEDHRGIAEAIAGIIIGDPVIAKPWVDAWEAEPRAPESPLCLLGRAGGHHRPARRDHLSGAGHPWHGRCGDLARARRQAPRRPARLPRLRRGRGRIARREHGQARARQPAAARVPPRARVSAAMRGPLDGVRVVDLTGDSGRFATKLLAECGASVARLGQGGSGPAMQAPDAARLGGLLDWWYDGGKERVDVDLDTEAGREAYRLLAAQADLIVETEAPGRLASLGIDHADLVAGNPRLVQVSLTPFGRTGPRSAWQTSDLVTAALGGVLSVSGLPDQPVNPWGRQSFNVAGFHAAIAGLSGVRAARVTGKGQLVDLSMHEAVCTTVEQLFFQYWFDDVQAYPKVAPRQGSLHWIGAYEVVPAASGWLMITPTPDVPALLAWMAEENSEGAVELAARSLIEVVSDVPYLMKVMTAFAATKDATTLFEEAQARHIAFGEVQSVAQVAANPQHAFREFFRPVEWDGPTVAVPGPVARFRATPAPAPRPPDPSTVDVERLLERWGSSTEPEGDHTPLTKPLEGLRVLDLSHVLAGPFCTRMLGDLGADILKVQTAERAVIVNDPNHPYFYVWNRSKRNVSLNMKDERARDVVRRLVEQSDVLIENFSAGVLGRWGLAYEDVSAWNPGIVYLTMSGCGHEGPWSNLVTYAPTIHALSGLTYLSNPPGRGDVGPGFSLNDHAAGLSAAFSVLAALEARERTGTGQHVDISQMETGAYLIGPALLDLIANGREAQPVGNLDPFAPDALNECHPTADGRWLAITCRSDGDRERLLAATGIDDVSSLASWVSTVSADEAQQRLQDAGVPAGAIQDAGDLMVDPQLVARGMWHRIDHGVFGDRPYDRHPARWSGMDLAPYVPPPSYVGEHNFEVYEELAGLDAGEIAEGMADGLFS